MSEENSNGSAQLWDKRTGFANQIRRKQRSLILQQKRKVLYTQHLKQLQLEKIPKIQNITYKQIIKALQTGPKEEYFLHQLLHKLQSANQNITFITSYIFQTGKYCYLIENLNQNRFMKQTLSIFSLILAKNNFRYTRFLVQKGFLQILLEMFPQQYQFTGIIANIVGNICVESDDFCDKVLDNFKHLMFTDMFWKLYKNFNQNINSYNLKDDLNIILWTLGIIVSTKQSTLDFTKQYDDILLFCKGLLQEGICLTSSLQVIYELANKNPQRVQQKLGCAINELLKTETGQSAHLQNLLYLIYKLTPGDFRYDLIFNLTFVANHSIAFRTLCIVERLQDSQIARDIAKNQAWWQKMLMKLQNNNKQYQHALLVIKKLKIRFPCVWRFVNEYLDETYEKQRILQIMQFLRSSLISAAQQSSNVRLQLLQNIDKFDIQKSLNKIFERQKHDLSSKAQQLLFSIQNLAKQFSDKYQIQV